MAIGHLPDHKIELYIVKKNSKTNVGAIHPFKLKSSIKHLISVNINMTILFMPIKNKKTTTFFWNPPKSDFFPGF